MSAALTEHSAAVDDGRHLARGALANTLVLVASNFRALFTFLIARLLGEAALGRFGLMFATVDLASRVATLGLEHAVVPFVARAEAARNRSKVHTLFVRAVMLGAGASLALAAVGIPVLLWAAGRREVDAFTGGASWMLLALPGIALGRIATGVSRGLLAMRNEFYSRGLGETWVTTAVFVGAIALGIRDAAPALAVVAGSTAGGLIAIWLAAIVVAKPGRIATSAPIGTTSTEAAQGRGRRELQTENPQDTEGGPGDARRLLSFALPTAGSGLLNTLAQRVDVLLLGFFVGRAPGVTLESFGIFCAAAEVAGGLRKVRQVFDPILAPVATTRHVTDREALRETVAAPGRWVLAGQLPLVGVLMLAGGSVLSIYGSSFSAGGQWLALLALAHLTNSFSGLVETLLVIERPSLNLMNAAVTVIAQTIVSFVLIPSMGVTGAALAMCFGFALQGALRFVELRQVFGWAWPWRSLLRPAAAFAVAMLLAAALRSAALASLSSLAAELLAGAVFLAIYALMWLWMGPDPADKAVWKRLMTRS
ncbi:MAG: oligosaccharide flippase family protein [Vicinamibacterales bacterium]